MARPRDFDETAVLDRAMHAFRAHGYGGLSIQALQQATGLTSGSLYNAYGDKAGVFRAALAHYIVTIVGSRIAAFAGNSATLDDLQELYLSLLRWPQTDGFGCLVTNTAIEFGAAPSIAFDLVKDCLDRLEEAITAVLARELPPAMVQTSKTRLMMIYQGMLTSSRAGRLGDDVEPMIRDEFDNLRSRRVDHGQIA